MKMMNKVTYHDQPGLKLVSNTTAILLCLIPIPVFYNVSFQYHSHFTVSQSNTSLLQCLFPIPQPFYCVSFQYQSFTMSLSNTTAILLCPNPIPVFYNVSFQYHSHFTVSHSNTSLLQCLFPIPQPFYYVPFQYHSHFTMSQYHTSNFVTALCTMGTTLGDVFHSNHTLSVVSAYCGCRGAMWYAECVSQDLLWLCKG